jgi:Protein of unknown function (DUF1090)
MIARQNSSLTGLQHQGKPMTFRGCCTRLAVVTAVFAGAQFAHAAESCDKLAPCAAKACRMDAQIAQAKADGDAKRLAALERASAEGAHCSDDGLKQKRKVALEQAQRRIDQRQAELTKVQASGDAAKIKKAQRKLDSARHAYAEIESSPL